MESGEWRVESVTICSRSRSRIVVELVVILNDVFDALSL